ncbi:cytochrome c biogenesis protein CcsA [Sunxiuqinia sp. A32]|uniref:cytochrome c biogenesis protein CcsA n=1 Tax=Sunxiuqinia sp. A32 TaxID=3461496 RepID=UPI0040466B7D
MKKIASILFSMFTSSVLIVVFAASIAYATFIENDYGTETAKILIYNAWWFNILLIVTGINLIGGLFFYKAFVLKRWSMILFHLAFIVILIGAGTSRFFSYEGTLHIREGASNNKLVTENTFIQLEAFSGEDKVVDEWGVRLSPYTYPHFNKSVEVGGTSVKLSDLQFVPSAEETAVADEGGYPVISFIILDASTQRQDKILEINNDIQFNDFSISFEGQRDEKTLYLDRSSNNLALTPFDTIQTFSMDGTPGNILPPGEPIELTPRSMYKIGETVFVLKSYFPKGRKIINSVQGPNRGAAMDAIQLMVSANGESKPIVFFGKNGIEGRSVNAKVGGIQLKLSYGAKVIDLPFNIHLNDFQLDRYPGSMSPSSYASEVTLVDEKNNVELPYRIYMNNILDYGGYRFFQSSYDQDEKGTVLSVSHDAVGTAITYWGYFLMTLGMVFTFFNRKSRFHALLRSGSRLKELKKKALNLSLLLCLFLIPQFSSAQFIRPAKIDKEIIHSFDELLVQDHKGRVEPLNTLASEVLRKLTRKNTYEGMSASEVYLGMSVRPSTWKNIPIIKVGNSELRRDLGLKDKYASFNSLVDMSAGVYRLKQFIDAAYKKKPTERNKYDKEVINVDERVNICFQIFNGDFLRIFPDKEDANDTWITEDQFYKKEENSGKEPTLSNYFMSVSAAIDNGNYQKAESYLQEIKDLQMQHGAKIIPSKSKVKMEIWYNRFNIFSLLQKICGLLGFYLLIVHLIQIFNIKARLNKFQKPGTILITLAFIAYSFGLIVRWYISGHAPWSNGYETMLFVGWATLLSGFIFMKRSPITLPVTTILTSLILMVAGLSWMNPEITNLVPVLKSYWLIVHVAVITASYGFLGIAALLGLLNLILMVIRSPRTIKSASYTIVEISIIIELALIIGLILLTIGAFIGGVWANESWGRYWGWDPKETWALVTILVYSFIIHLRKIPGMNSSYVLSSFSLAAISSVLMTFFGVNYYLSGMHSYAQGEAPPIPAYIYVAAILIFALIIAGAFSEKKHGTAEALVKLDEKLKD